MFPFADAVSVPVVNKGPAMFSTPVVPWVHVDPAAEPVIPAAAVDVTVPLFVTVMAPKIEIPPANERFADEGIVRAAKMNSVPVFVIDPVPSMLVPAPLTEIGPVPLSVPFTTRFPVTPSVKVEMATTPVPFTVRFVMLALAFNVTVCPPLMTASSPAAGAVPPTQVPPALQMPDPADCLVTPIASELKTTQRTASAMHANRTERKILDSHFTLLTSTSFVAKYFL